MVKKRKIGILYGGVSAEHDVSVRSAVAVIKNMDKEKYNIVPIYIDTSGKWHYNCSPINDSDKKKLFNTNNHKTEGDSLVNYQKEIEKNSLDVVFPILHGTLGEDGTIQGMLDVFNIPYVGCNVLSSAIAMDKAIAKQLVSSGNINMPKFKVLHEYKWANDKNAILYNIMGHFSSPVFVKPCNIGSSIGINKVKNLEELSLYINEAFLYDEKILIEEAIIGKELELSVLENINDRENPFVSVPGELVPSDEFYTFDAKYINSNGAEFYIPARLTKEKIEESKKIAAKIFKILECKSFARVDLFFDTENNKFLFNEVNTIPGFTEISLYPKLFECSGIKYTVLLDKLIELAIFNHSIRKKKISNSITFKEQKKLS